MAAEPTPAQRAEAEAARQRTLDTAAAARADSQRRAAEARAATASRTSR